MKQSIFTNRNFYYLLIGYLVILILYNLYIGILQQNFFALIPIAIQSCMLFLIFSKNQYAKATILTWAIVVLLIATSVQVIGDLLDQGLNAVQTYSFIYQLVQLIIAILIIDFTRRTVIVVRPGQEIPPVSFNETVS